MRNKEGYSLIYRDADIFKLKIQIGQERVDGPDTEIVISDHGVVEPSSICLLHHEKYSTQHRQRVYGVNVVNVERGVSFISWWTGYSVDQPLLYTLPIPGYW